MCLSASTAATQSPEPLAVEVSNASEPVLCAEKDNVTLNLASKDVRRFRIEAAHPAYIGTIQRDSFEADWTGCTAPSDPTGGDAAAAQAHHALRADRFLGLGSHVPELLAAGHGHRAHRRPRREEHPPAASVDDPAHGRRGGGRALPAGRLLAPAAAGAARPGAHGLRLLLSDRAGGGRAAADREDQGGCLRAQDAKLSRSHSSAAARLP